MDKLATFRVKEEQWESFKKLCSDSGTNASAAMIAHIQNCLDSGTVETVDTVAAIVPSVVTRSEFDQLRDDLADLRDDLGKSYAA